MRICGHRSFHQAAEYQHTGCSPCPDLDKEQQVVFEILENRRHAVDQPVIYPEHYRHGPAADARHHHADPDNDTLDNVLQVFHLIHSPTQVIDPDGYPAPGCTLMPVILVFGISVLLSFRCPCSGVLYPDVLCSGVLIPMTSVPMSGVPAF
jgi:hypothetical protein